MEYHPAVTVVDTFLLNGDCYLKFTCTFCGQTHNFRGQTNNIINRYYKSEGFRQKKSNYVYDSNEIKIVAGPVGPIDRFMGLPDIYPDMTIAYFFTANWQGQVAIKNCNFTNDSIMCNNCLQAKIKKSEAIIIWCH